MNSRLRELIELMVSDLDANPLETHAARLAEIARTVPHTISPLRSTESLEKYNCVMHALGLIGRITFYEHPLLLSRLAFVNHLVESKALQTCEPRTGALVTWSSQEGLQHIGRLISPSRAKSKWGLGILCEHGLYEIPLRYGDVSGYYCPIESSSALDYLMRWVFGEPGH